MRRPISVPAVNSRQGQPDPVGAGLVEAAEFAVLMDQLGPFEPAPRLAVAVSGGADSLALALLAESWARDQGGSILALIVDHGLRESSAAEAVETADRLAARGIAWRVIPLTGLPYGSGLADRARQARYQVLFQACEAAGIVHLLLGHHLADQAETLLIRVLGGSAASGLAAMASLVETQDLRLLRPLLGVSPVRLRAHLRAAGIGWVEDPSNHSMDALRPRLRALRADRDGIGSASRAIAAAAAAHGGARAVRQRQCAITMAEIATLHPEGFAILPRAPLPPDVLAALIQAISGARYGADSLSIAALAADPRPATLAGVRLIEISRAAVESTVARSLLMLREEAAIAPDASAHLGAIWDGRFRMRAVSGSVGKFPHGLVLGKLGDAASGFRRRSSLPSALLRTLPALWRRADPGTEDTPESKQNHGCCEKLVAVPHLGYVNEEVSASIGLVFAPSRPAAPASFST